EYIYTLGHTLTFSSLPGCPPPKPSHETAQQKLRWWSMARRKREFTPDDKKDDGYWDKRKKNNEAAKRSREKRRVSDLALEGRVLALLEENARLKAELLALKFRFELSFYPFLFCPMK
uniref:BZIP domain-containing protein n=1 Tax=Naja naja TaxID=35670 RepID=A0A8C6YGH8_NAJNA